MSEWITARQIASAGLPDLPSSRFRIREYAKRHNWKSREVAGAGLRGGARVEYHISNLTEAQQAALIEYFARGQKSALPAVVADSDSGAGATPAIEPATQAAVISGERYERATAKAKRRAESRLNAVVFATELIDSGLHTAQDADAKAADKFGVSAAAVQRWRTLLKDVPREGWLGALIDDHHGNPREPRYDERIFEWFKSDYLRMDRPPAQACYRRAIAIAREQGVEESRIPECITLVRRLRRALPWQSIKFAREGHAALHRTSPAQRRDRSGFHALEAVNGDGYRWNVAVVWPGGEVSRPVMWSWQDIYSGMILAWRIDKTENAGLIRLVIGDLVRDWGIPELFVLDNTMAAANKWLTGRAPTRHRFKIKSDDPMGTIILLGSNVTNTTPGTVGAPAKPIERVHGDFDRDIARHPALAKAWLGTNPMTRPDAAREPVPYAKFIEIVRQGINEHNSRPGRRTPVCSGRSFEEVFRESYEKSVIRKATAEQLRLCMLAAEHVLCRKRDGAFELRGNVYYSEATAALAGQRVVLRFDPENLRQSVFIYASDGRYIGEAQCRLPVGFADADAAREHNRLRRANLRRHKQIVRAEKTMSELQLAAMLPKSPDPEPVSARVVRLVKLRIEPPRSVDPDEEMIDESELNWRKYRELRSKPRESLSEDDLLWARVYEGGSAFRVRQKLFGEAV